jgi:hypothetical protein
MIYKATSAILNTTFRRAAFSLLAATGLGLVSVASAQVVNVDFQPGGTPAGNSSINYSGQGAYSDPGNNVWNNVAPVDGGGGYQNEFGSGGFSGGTNGVTLVNSAGAATGLTLDIGSADMFAIASTNGSFANIADNAKGLMSDYLITPSDFSRYVNLNGLDTSATYDLYLYGAADFTSHHTQFTLSNGDISFGTLATSGVPGGSHDLTAGADYVVFHNVTAATGFLGITYQGVVANDEGSFNGFQLVVVPEPATSAMVLMGILGTGWLITKRKVSGETV